MKIRELTEKYLTEYAVDLKSPRSLRLGIEVWLKRAPNVDISEIGIDTFTQFRRTAIAEGLKPKTIETAVGRVMTLLRYAFDVLGAIKALPPKGRRLKIVRKPADVPTLEEVSAAYQFADAALWPQGLHIPPDEFWRCWLVVEFFTGLRFSDVTYELNWSHVRSNGIFFQAGKTDKLHVFPIPPVLADHLERLRGPHERLFPVKKCDMQMRRELRRICTAACIRKITPQMMRRLAFNAWQDAKFGAGQLLLGHSLGVSDFYAAKVPELLTDAAEKLKLPPAFGTGPTPKPTTAPFHLPEQHEPQFRFEPGRFSIGGRWYPLRTEALRVLRLLVESGRPCTYREIAEVAYSGDASDDDKLLRKRATAATCRLRSEVRKRLGISKAYNIVVTADSGENLAWTIHLPDSAIQEAIDAAKKHPPKGGDRA